MRSFNLLLLLLSAGPAAAADPRHVVAAPQDGAPGVTIAMPPGLARLNVQGIDSTVAAFEGEGIALSFDYGWYSAILSCEGRAGCAERHETIGGRDARLVEAPWPDAARDRYRRYVGLLFELGGPVRLSASATCVDRRACARALSILRTIGFEALEPPGASAR